MSVISPTTVATYGMHDAITMAWSVEGSAVPSVSCAKNSMGFDFTDTTGECTRQDDRRQG